MLLSTTVTAQMQGGIELTMENTLDLNTKTQAHCFF